MENDPFDINDRFYREICTQYESENGTDVLLDTREEYYYSPSKRNIMPRKLSLFSLFFRY